MSRKFNKNWHWINVFYWGGKYRFLYTDMHFWEMSKGDIVGEIVLDHSYRGHRVFVTVGKLYDYIDLKKLAERTIDDVIEIGEVVAY